MRLQARLTVQFPPLTHLLPLNIHLQARLTVQSYPLTLQLPLQVPVLVQPGPMNLNWIHPLNLKMHQLYGILLSDSTSESYYFKSTVFLHCIFEKIKKSCNTILSRYLIFFFRKIDGRYSPPVPRFNYCCSALFSSPKIT